MDQVDEAGKAWGNSKDMAMLKEGALRGYRRIQDNAGLRVDDGVTILHLTKDHPRTEEEGGVLTRAKGWERIEVEKDEPAVIRAGVANGRGKITAGESRFRASPRPSTISCLWNGMKNAPGEQ